MLLLCYFLNDNWYLFFALPSTDVVIKYSGLLFVICLYKVSCDNFNVINNDDWQLDLICLIEWLVLCLSDEAAKWGWLNIGKENVTAVCTSVHLFASIVIHRVKIGSYQPVSCFACATYHMRRRRLYVYDLSVCVCVRAWAKAFSDQLAIDWF